MKNPYYIFLLSVLITGSLAFYSCDDDDKGVAPAPVGELRAEADYGSVILSWKNPLDDPNFYYVNISYTDSNGKLRNKKVSHFAADPTSSLSSDTITGFMDVKTYAFTLTACSREGAASGSVSIEAAPLEPAHQIITKYLSVTPDYGGARISWNNPTHKKIQLRISYQDDSDKEVIASVHAEPGDGFYTIHGLKNPGKTYLITAISEDNNISDPVLFENMDPVPEIKIPKTGWAIPGYKENQQSGLGWSSQQSGAGNRVINIFDDNDNTFWHTRYSVPIDFPPHWFIVDLQQERILSRVECTRRKGNNQGHTSYKILTLPEGASAEDLTDESKWEEQGSFLFNINADGAQSQRLVNNPKTRYVKLYTENCPYYFAMLAEFTLYGE